MECFNIYSWYLRAIEVKCVIKKNGFRHSTLVCMKPCLKVKNENQNRLELLNKRSKLASEADSLNGKEFHIESISFQNSLKLRKYLIIVLYAFLEFICFSRIFKETFFYAHNHLWRCVSAGKQECTAHFTFYFNFCITFQLVKKRGKMKEDCFKYTLPKKIRKANKTKKN